MKDLFNFLTRKKTSNFFKEVELRKTPAHPPRHFCIGAIEILDSEKMILIPDSKTSHEDIHELLTGYDVATRNSHSIPRTFEWSETKENFVIEEKLSEALDFLLQNQACSQITAYKISDYLSKLVAIQKTANVSSLPPQIKC
jgi:hypothetical protein